MRSGVRLNGAGVLLALTACSGGGTERSAPAVDLERLLPAPAAVAGWRAAERPATYLPGTLYDVLDGGAERHLSYGFRRLVRVRFASAADEAAGVTLDLFDMGSELGAFGIYGCARPRGIVAQPWGAEGYRAGSVAAAWKGSLYVHAEADDERPALVAMAERLVAGACEALPGAVSAPAVLRPLPRAGLVRGSERYVAADLLGHEFLPGGVEAAYDLRGREVELFYSDLGRAAAARDALAAFRAHHAGRGELRGEATVAGVAGFRCSAPGLGNSTVVASGRFVAGALGGLEHQELETLLASLLTNLAAAPTPRRGPVLPSPGS